jgi:hypothetical protein
MLVEGSGLRVLMEGFIWEAPKEPLTDVLVELLVVQSQVPVAVLIEVPVLGVLAQVSQIFVQNCPTPCADLQQKSVRFSEYPMINFIMNECASNAF